MDVGREVASIPSAFWLLVNQYFSQPQSQRILLVGASEINRRVLSMLERREFSDITVCNRSHDKIRELQTSTSLKLDLFGMESTASVGLLGLCRCGN